MPLSYSALATYKQCPRKYKYSYVDRLPRGPASPAMERGTMMHKQIEDYVTGEIDTLCDELSHYESWLDDLKQGECETEWSFGITEDLEPCAFDAEDCAFRGFVDLKHRVGDALTLYEWKTGKKYPEHATQMWYYAVMAMLHYPEVDGVDVYAGYLDLGQNKHVWYPRHMMMEYVPALKRYMAEPGNDEIFMPKPDFMCRYCNFSRQNGGPCQF